MSCNQKGAADQQYTAQQYTAKRRETQSAMTRSTHVYHAARRTFYKSLAFFTAIRSSLESFPSSSSAAWLMPIHMRGFLAAQRPLFRFEAKGGIKGEVIRHAAPSKRKQLKQFPIMSNLKQPSSSPLFPLSPAACLSGKRVVRPKPRSVELFSSDWRGTGEKTVR